MKKKPLKLHWYGMDPFNVRCLFVPGKEGFDQLIKENPKLDLKWEPKEWTAAWTFYTDTCPSDIFICLCKDDPDLINHCAHEAFHAVQQCFRHVGEEAPGEETAAYLVGNVTAWLYRKVSEMPDTRKKPAKRRGR